MEAHSANILRKSGRSASRRGGYVRVAGQVEDGCRLWGAVRGSGAAPRVAFQLCPETLRAAVLALSGKPLRAAVLALSGKPSGPRFSSVRKTLRVAFWLCPENPPGRRFGSVRKTLAGGVLALSGKPCGRRFSSVRKTLRAAFWLCPEYPPEGGRYSVFGHFLSFSAASRRAGTDAA